ncbi:MAG: DUF542 domain-containing protein [Proteobacteria bacterium]|nr:DUF542 domain-containing protein [Pseudomonadota bacterium]
MDKIDGNMTINDVIKAYPSTLSTFNTFGIDSCCGGANTLAKACQEKGVDLAAFLRALNEAAA